MLLLHLGKEDKAFYVTQTTIHTLDDDTTKDLEMLLLKDEVAIAATPSGKSPGPDALLPHSINDLPTNLFPLLTKLFNSLSEGSVFPPQTLEAHISLIPKPDKYPTLCVNYRPISFIGVDLKVFAKVLAN